MGRKVDRVAMVMVSIFFTQEDSGLQGLEWEYEMGMGIWTFEILGEDAYHI